MAAPTPYLDAPLLPVLSLDDILERRDVDPTIYTPAPAAALPTYRKRSDTSTYSDFSTSSDSSGDTLPSAYAAAPPPLLPTAKRLKRSDTASTVSLTSTSEAAGVTSTPTTASSATTIGAYWQLAGKTGSATGFHFPQATLAAADYHAFCPGGNCLSSCQNTSRVFQAAPQGISINEASYGKAVPKGQLPDLTLFGVCSNLETLTTLAATDSVDTSFSSYFPAVNAQMALHNVSNDLSLCFIDTCQATRDPSQCYNYCTLDSLRQSDTSISVTNGVYPCLWRLCDNTCGLPYANQDVYGVGVLASYIIQAILVITIAIALIALATWKVFRRQGDFRLEIPKRVRDSLELFLAAECFFGISAALASYFMHPSTIDPLNGYALMSVAITGFIPPTFTLMLLHIHGSKSIYTSFLTFSTWLFSTVLFFSLFQNLSKTVSDPEVLDRSLNALFSIDSCGGSSAMALCQQAFDTDPLAYLSWFYNYWSIPSVRTVPIVWVLSAVVLLLLLGIQVLESFRRHVGKKRRFNAGIVLGSLYLGATLFGLALGYQATMVIAYTHMDVIDWHGWSFGQVVALLFWIPPIFDSIRTFFLESGKKSVQYKSCPDEPISAYSDSKLGVYDEKSNGIDFSTNEVSSSTVNLAKPLNTTSYADFQSQYLMSDVITPVSAEDGPETFSNTIPREIDADQRVGRTSQPYLQSSRRSATNRSNQQIIR